MVNHSPPSASPPYSPIVNLVSRRRTNQFRVTQAHLLGFSRVPVNGQENYSRVITARAWSGNEDLTIVMISNLPSGLFLFVELRNSILELLVDEYGLGVKDIQKRPSE